MASLRALCLGSLVTTNRKSSFFLNFCCKIRGYTMVEFSAGKMYLLTSLGVSWPQSSRSSTMMVFMAQKVITVTKSPNFARLDLRKLNWDTLVQKKICVIFKKSFSTSSSSMSSMSSVSMSSSARATSWSERRILSLWILFFSNGQKEEKMISIKISSFSTHCCKITGNVFILFYRLA